MQKEQNAAGRALKAALWPALPVITGFIFPGLAYGILMSVNGHGVLISLIMSAVAFCGSMQYAAVPFLAAPFSPLGAFLLALAVNARHLFYGISMIDRYRGTGKLKFFLIYYLCDETYSVLAAKKAPVGVDDKLFCFFVSFLNYASWSVFTVLGCIAGNFIPAEVSGLDFVLTALFASIFLSWWSKRENRSVAMLGIFAAGVCRIIFGAQYFLPPTLAVLLFVLVILRKRIGGVGKV